MCRTDQHLDAGQEHPTAIALTASLEHASSIGDHHE
jgi:hypothetical protein